MLKNHNLECECYEHNASFSEVQHGILNCFDFVHVEVRYHQCRFRNLEPYKKGVTVEKEKSGRPQNKSELIAFQKICGCLETEFQCNNSHKKHDMIAGKKT